MSGGVGWVYGGGYLCASPTNGSAFVRKYDFNGNLVWNFNISAPAGISASTNGIYVVGGYNSTRSYVENYDTKGNLIWTRLSGIVGYRISVIAESSGIYVAYASSSVSGQV